MCGHGIVAVTTIALERGLIMPRAASPTSGQEESRTIVYDAPAGTIRARARLGQSATARVESVAFANVPSFVLHGGLVVRLANRQVRADVAFGGAFYAIV